MRAIGALVTMLLLLAAIQAGYMLVDAHKGEHRGHHSLIVHDKSLSHHKDDPMKMQLDRRTMHKNIIVEKHNSSHVYYKDEELRKGRRKGEYMNDKRKLYYTDTSEKKHRRKYGGNRTDSKQHYRKDKKHSSNTNYHSEPINVYMPGTKKNDSSAVKQLLQVAIESPEIHATMVVPPPLPDSWSQPELTQRPDNNIHKSKKVERTDKDTHLEKEKHKIHYEQQESGVVLKKEEHKEHKEHKGHRNRWGHKRTHKDKRRTCDTLQDCSSGECCVEKAGGDKYCMPGGTRTEGKHCKDGCMCKAGLQCFVSTQKHKHRKLSQHIGKCVNTDRINYEKGHLLPTAPTDSLMSPLQDQN